MTKAGRLRGRADSSLRGSWTIARHLVLQFATGLPVASAVVLLVARPAVTVAQSSPADSRFQRIVAVVEAQMRDLGVPGVALGIHADGATQIRTFGITSVDNPLPVTENTIFQIGSITKTMTALAVMRLVESGRLSLDAPLKTYIPGFRVRDAEATARTSLRTLLTHMGGWEGDLFVDPGDGDDALAMIVSRMTELEQVIPFNSAWSYNNAGFYVAGRAIELVTGEPYRVAIHTLVFESLGLVNTYMNPVDVMTRRFAVGHGERQTKPVVLRPWALPRAIDPAGGGLSNVRDLLRYGRFHLGDGIVPSGERVISRASLRLMQKNLVPIRANEYMGLSWRTTSRGALREVWHDGVTLGQCSLLLLVPSKGLVLAVLTNSIRGEALIRAVRREVDRVYLDLDVVDRVSLDRATNDLDQFVGRYSRPFMDVIVTMFDGHLMVQRVQKQGFPAPSSPVPSPAPPVAYRFYAPDRLVGTGPLEGDVVDVLRRSDGTVGWLRVSDRLVRRVDSGTP